MVPRAAAAAAAAWRGDTLVPVPHHLPLDDRAIPWLDRARHLA
eukprot:COSAG01_NODE_36440_length_517_cov_20.736842_1_plen_42_part_10